MQSGMCPHFVEVCKGTVSSAVSTRAECVCELKGGSHMVGFGAFLLRCCSFEVRGASPGLGPSAPLTPLECGRGLAWPVRPVNRPSSKMSFYWNLQRAVASGLTHMVSQLLVMSFFSGQLISLFLWSALKMQSRLGKWSVISSLSAIFFFVTEQWSPGSA